MKTTDDKKSNAVALSLMISIAVSTIFFLGNCFLFFYTFHNQEISYNQLANVILNQNSRREQQSKILDGQGTINNKLNNINTKTSVVIDKTQKVLKTANLAQNLITKNISQNKLIFPRSFNTSTSTAAALPQAIPSSQIIIKYKRIPVYVFVKVRVPVFS